MDTENRRSHSNKKRESKIAGLSCLCFWTYSPDAILPLKGLLVEEQVVDIFELYTYMDVKQAKLVWQLYFMFLDVRMEPDGS